MILGIRSASAAIVSILFAGQVFAADTFGRMEVDAVAKRLSEKTFHVYDANSEKVYENAHVPGATHLGFDEIAAGKLPPQKSDTLVFYCKNLQCSASHEAAKKASSLGYTSVFIMPAGIDGWVKAGKQTVKGPQPG